MLKHKFVAAWSEFLLYYLIQAFRNLKMTQLKKKIHQDKDEFPLCIVGQRLYCVWQVYFGPMERESQSMS